MNLFHPEAARRLAAALDRDAQSILPLLVRPPQPEMGDIAFPCFTLAKELRKAPPAIAVEAAKKILPGEPFAAIEAAGPYVNFRLSPNALVDS